MDCSMLGLPVHHQILEFTQTHVYWVGDPSIQISHPLSNTSLPTFNLSQPQGLFQWVSGQSIGVSASGSVLPMGIQDWFLLGLTGWISWQYKGPSLLQHYSSKASFLQHSAFFIVQLSHPYMTPGKTIAFFLCWTFVGIVKSLHFNILSRLVIDFLPRSKLLLISWLPSPSAQWFWSPPK